MLEHIAFGGGLAFAAVVQPGPLQAFLLTRATSEGGSRTLPAALSPLLSDGPIALLVLLAVGRLPVMGQLALRLAGGVLLLYLAGSSLVRWRANAGDAAPGGTATPRTLGQAVLVNLLNPNPWLGWALVLGPAVVAAWRVSPANAVALLVAFYGVMVAGLAGFILLAGSARRLPDRARRGLVFGSALVLAGLGLGQLATGAWKLLGH